MFSFEPTKQSVSRANRQSAAAEVPSAPTNKCWPVVNQLFTHEPIQKVNSATIKLLCLILNQHFDHVNDSINELTTAKLQKNSRSSPLENISLPMTREILAWRSMEYLFEPLASTLESELSTRLEKSKPEILDFGAGFGECAAALKFKHKNKIEMHIATLEKIPACKVDQAHIVAGEYLPKSWDSSFDLIYSQGALHFSAFPSLVIHNLGLSLAPGGVAMIMTEALTSPAFNSLAFRGLLLEHYGLGKQPEVADSSYPEFFADFKANYYAAVNKALATLHAERGITSLWFENDSWVAQREKLSHPYYLLLQRPE